MGRQTGRKTDDGRPRTSVGGRWSLVGFALCALLFCSLPAQAQTKCYAAGVIGPLNTFGFANPIYGASGGCVVSREHFGFSVDANLDRVRKVVGGPGYQISAEQTARFYLKPKLFIQAGAVEQHYSVRDFSKSSLQPLVGIGYAPDESQIFSVSYRHDLTSENRQRLAVLRWQLYHKSHFYLDAQLAVSRFRSGKSNEVGTAAKFGLGFWF